MKAKAILALILCCAFWGISFPVIKALMIELEQRTPAGSSFHFSSWVQMSRFLIAAVIMLCLTWKISRPGRLELRQGCLIAFWGGLGMWLQAYGLAYTEASTSAFLTQAYCVFLPIWVSLRDRKSPGKNIIVATCLVLLGGAILAGVRPDHFKIGRGELATLASAFLFTFQILTLENPKYADNRGRSVTLVMCVVVFILFLPISLVTAPHPLDVIASARSFSVFTLVIILALVCTVGAYLLMNTWQRHVTSTQAGLIYTTEPVFTAWYALFLPGMLAGLMGHPYANETLTSQLLIGGGLILLANFIVVAAMRNTDEKTTPKTEKESA